MVLSVLMLAQFNPVGARQSAVFAGCRGSTRVRFAADPLWSWVHFRCRREFERVMKYLSISRLTATIQASGIAMIRSVYA